MHLKEQRGWDRQAAQLCKINPRIPANEQEFVHPFLPAIHRAENKEGVGHELNRRRLLPDLGIPRTPQDFPHLAETPLHSDGRQFRVPELQPETYPFLYAISEQSDDHPH